MADSWEDLPDVKGADDWEKLPDVAEPPAGKVPSPTGWRDAEHAKKSIMFRPEDWEADQAKQSEAMWGALAAGAHGAANAMEGPINGAIAALTTPPMTEKGPTGWEDILKRYRDERDRVQGAQKENLKRFPLAPAVGAVLTSPGSAPTALGRLAMGVGQGALYGVGSSEGDLTKGETDKVAHDAKIGGLIGGGGALLGEALQIPGRALAKRAQNISDATHAAELAGETDARASAMRSAIASNGGEHSAAAGMIKSMRDAITNPNTDPALKRAAEEFLASPEGVALHNQALSGNIGRAYSQNARIAAAKEAMQKAIAENNPEAVRAAAAASAESKLADPSGVTKRLAELARRNIPPAVGAAVGGAPGAAAGALVAGSMGKPGTIVSNMMKSPSAFLPLTKAAGVGIGAGQSVSRAVPPLGEWSKFLRKEDEASDE